MPKMTRRTDVMRMHNSQRSDRHIYFQYERDESEKREGVYMTQDNWTMMGQPTEITVTIEPGNTMGPFEEDANGR